MTRREYGAIGALGFILLVTVGWWAAALWPLPAETPEWVVRARAACFGATANGLPNSGGWVLLIGSPLSMLGALLIIWGGAVGDGFRGLSRSRAGRALLTVGACTLLLGIGAAYGRVVNASGLPGARAVAESAAFTPASLPARLNRATPALSLLDQHGQSADLERFRGRIVLLTFAYGRCETVCPVIVHNALEARRELNELVPVILVVTLDPWRDTPARLPRIAATWQLPPDAFLLGGTVDEVEATLDAWEIARARDLRTGEIAHPSLVYLIDPDGKLAFAVSGNREQIVAATRRIASGE
jgi:cytochrome oxidase Cu insertion factor (SCO1/SenC/PrrC family)